MQPPRSKTEALEAVPVPLPEVRSSTSESGLVRLSYPAALKPWLARLLPASLSRPQRTLELDAMGSRVWSMIDGQATVRDIARQVASHYACHPAEAEQAVALFVRQLGQRGILGLL
jgi:hypothetical protein